jgi:hypothetical protein
MTSITRNYDNRLQRYTSQLRTVSFEQILVVLYISLRRLRQCNNSPTVIVLPCRPRISMPSPPDTARICRWPLFMFSSSDAPRSSCRTNKMESEIECPNDATCATAPRRCRGVRHRSNSSSSGGGGGGGIGDSGGRSCSRRSSAFGARSTFAVRWNTTAISRCVSFRRQIRWQEACFLGKFSCRHDPNGLEMGKNAGSCI